MQLEDVMQEQHGVVARSQVLAAGHDDAYIETRLRRRDWARIHTGVYVDHTGPPSWSQRLWAALVFYGDAAACDESTLVLFGLRAAGASETVHVAVDQGRRLTRLDGVRLHRLKNLADHVHPSRRPPSLRLETAVLRTASSRKDDASAVAVLADACQSRRTTAGRLAERLTTLRRLPRRALLLEILEDVATGAFSVLEHRYLTRVERPHGLPTAARQRRVVLGRRAAYRDVDSAVARSTTVRITWGQVLHPCRVAAAVARLLHAVGWSGQVTSCGPGCSATRADAA